ncbi:hypothetical protein EDD15DRAFT_2226044 [Pisolithus albus]|nr:hypothetical protein EDD15DRAFT_2226044 [Pisolithus albus]
MQYVSTFDPSGFLMMPRMRFARKTGIRDMPQEILLMICGFLPLLDLVSLSQVSRVFWLLLKDEYLWKALYRTTKIVRPVGTAYCLRRILISSANVKENWPPFVKKPEFSRKLTRTHSIGYYYDLLEQPKPQPMLFYRPHLMALFFRCVTATNIHGDTLTFLITETQLGKNVRRVNICKVSASVMGPFVEPLMHYDLPENYPGIADVVIGSRLMILKPKANYINVPPTIYDFKDLRPCKLPPLPAEYQRSVAQHASFYHAEYVMTKSYVLIFYTFVKAPRALETLVLACPTTPVLQKNKESMLQVSHRTVVDGFVLANIRVMCDDTCESGTTRITLVGKKVTNCRAKDAALMAFQLTLHPVIDDEGSMNYNTVDLGTIPGRDAIWLETGPDECGRGVYNTPAGHIVLFSIEAENGQLRWHKSDELSCGPGLVRHSAMAFDGYRGMLCVKTVNMARNVGLEVWTVKRTTR